ncbi:hypothetical protein F4779DRAFT_622065 [Xylariaceae sp. FL0662B]|nr:hypothetical protein F4779DRAFT_622065 [Xylariaceae sp. FL0662B]
MASSYLPTIPSDVVVDERTRDFVSRYYAVSDDPSKNEEWVSYFAPDAVFVVGDKSAEGTEQIRQVRQGMWDKIGARKHKPEKIFPASFKPGEIEYMLYGSLDLTTKDGEKRAVSWAGHAVLKEVEGRLKYAFYQIYLHVSHDEFIWKLNLVADPI